ncbi:MAG: AAA family ATPase [Gemmatimonadota bacterium]|nr:AAA family ATPase [Gemmatimonadota bacterium]
MTDGTVKRRFEIDAEHVPDLPGMMLATVEALRELGGSATKHEIDDKVIELEGVTEAEQALTMTGNAKLIRVNYYLAWARTYLKRGNALVNPARGVWELSEAGAAISGLDDTLAICDRVTQEERERAQIKRQAVKAERNEDRDQFSNCIQEAESRKSIDVEDPNNGLLGMSMEWYLDRSGSVDVWTIAPGEGARLWREFLESGIVAIGWDHLGNLSRYETKEAIHSALIEHGAGKNPYNQSLAAWEFANEIKTGDIVLAKKGRRIILGWGKVTGEYTHLQERTEYKNVMTVDWRPCRKPIDLRGMITTKTLTRFTEYTAWLGYISELIDADAGEFEVGHDDDQDKSYNVAKALGDLFLGEDQFLRIRDAISLRKNLILQGPPGVGKTFIAKRIAWCLIGRIEPEYIENVQFHQSYAYEDFVQGWRPTESGGFTLRNGVFFEFCKRAERQKDKSKPFVFIIDEINRGNLSKIFGELLMLIEADKRGPNHAIPLTYSPSGERFSVPENVHLLGLMNTADRSLAIVDYALRRRFAFETLEPAFGTPKFRDYLLDADVDRDLVDRINRNFSQLNKDIREDQDLGPGFQIGHSYFVPDESADEEWYTNIVETQIAPLLREYWFDRPKHVEKKTKELSQ